MSEILSQDDFRDALISITGGSLITRQYREIEELIYSQIEAGTINSLIGENERPIFSGHSFCCIFCGELGGMCDLREYTGDGGLNSHVDGECGHKTLLCDCEKRNVLREQIRNLISQLKSI